MGAVMPMVVDIDDHDFDIKMKEFKKAIETDLGEEILTTSGEIMIDTAKSITKRELRDGGEWRGIYINAFEIETSKNEVVLFNDATDPFNQFQYAEIIEEGSGGEYVVPFRIGNQISSLGLYMIDHGWLIDEKRTRQAAQTSGNLYLTNPSTGVSVPWLKMNQKPHRIMFKAFAQSQKKIEREVNKIIENKLNEIFDG